VYVAKGADVRHSVIEGRVVMRDRDVLTLDEDRVKADADRLRARILETLAPR
jgi:5-methylthioadenosine/S-adenosylhomocysteine deaminase